MCPAVKISIVIPVYNVAPYISECLDSVMNQTWQGSLECILVDDCGTDDSMAVASRKLQDYQGHIAFRIVSHDSNRGLSAARNSGIEAATGDYVYFLDSDDEMTTDCIESLAGSLADESYDLVIGDYRIVGSNMPKAPLLLADGITLHGAEVLSTYRRSEWYMLSVNKLYRLSFLQSNHLRFLEGIIHEDELWSFQVACLAESLHVVRRETYIYKIREGSITVKRHHEQRCQCINIILKEMCDFSALHHLEQNEDVHHFIQNFQMITLNSIYKESPGLLPQFYVEQRRQMNTSWQHCLLLNGFDLRRQLRDLHLLMPVSCALPYLRLLFHFI